MTLEKIFEITVIGDGPVANAAILMAAKLGLSTIQVQNPPSQHAAVGHLPPSVPRTYAIAPHVQERLSALGAWHLIPAQAIQPAQYMRVFWQNEHLSPSYTPLQLSAYEGCVSQLCSFVTEFDLAQALTLAVQVVAGQRTVLQHTITQIQHTQDYAQISFANGQSIKTQLLIAADGAQSTVRKHLQLEPTVFDYGHSAVVAIVTSPHPHAHTAWQWLGRDSSVLALLPMPPAQESPQTQAPLLGRYGLVWSQASDQAQHCVDAPHTMLKQLNERCAATVGQLSLASPVQRFPLFQAIAPHSTAPHCVLVGDAAHRVHPLAGQGLNLGFEDIFALETILANRDWRQCGDERLLARYRRARALPMAQMSGLVHAIARRKDWPRPIEHLAARGIHLVQASNRLGSWFRGKIVQSAIQGHL